MTERIVKVTRKGQVTIPVEQRRKYSIKQGMRFLVKDSDQGFLLSPITPLEETSQE